MRYSGSDTSRAAKVKVQSKLYPDTSPDVQIQPAKVAGVKDPVIVVVGTPTEKFQLTICKPIGYTKVSPNGWVIVDSDKVPSYVSEGSKNPKEKEANLYFNGKRDDFMVAQIPDLVRSEDGSILFKGTSYKVLMDKASQSMKEKERSLKAAHVERERAAGRTLEKADPKVPGSAKQVMRGFDKSKEMANVHIWDFLPPDLSGPYFTFLEAWNKSQAKKDAAAVRDQTLAQHETCGGHERNIPQHELVWARGIPPDQVQKYVSKMIKDPLATLRDIERDFGPIVWPNPGIYQATAPRT